MRKGVRRVGGVLQWVTVVASVGILVFIGIGPRTGRYRTMTVLTGSMRPVISPGSVVVLTPEPARSLKVGQVITYRVPVGDRQIETHRVTRILEGGDHPVFETKGDANPAPDPWLARVEDDQVWRVRYVVPALGDGIRFLRHPLVHKVTVLASPVLLAASWLMAIWGGSRPTSAAVVVP